jgi:N6-adenosine-specific RNA methylase IME4
MEKFSVIYCDPPWDYAGRTQHTDGDFKEGKSAINHYDTMTLEQLKELKVSDICEKDCLIFMWSSSPHLVQALELMRGWGFEYKTVAFVWDKQKVNPGYYTMSQVELCLVGKRGKIPIRGSRNERQFLSEMRRSHSQKPDAVRDRIARMFPNVRKVELFARVATTGWSVWGNEVESGISI